MVQTLPPLTYSGYGVTPTDFGQISRLLQNRAVGSMLGLTPSYQPDQLTLQSPAALFGRSPNLPMGIPSLISPFTKPADQLQTLGKKYGVPYQGQSLTTYQKTVAEAIIAAKAQSYGIPLNVAMGMAGNESGRKMWSNPDKGTVTQGKNIRDGVLLSTDWGVMQINDKAHVKAFPRAKYDMEYNIDYGLKFLARQRNSIQGSLGLGFGDWDRTIASYNLGHNPQTTRSYEIATRYVSGVYRNRTIPQNYA